MSTSAKIGRRVYAGKCVTVFPSVEIGDFTTINSSSWIESGTLGKFCSVAANVSIGMEEHPLHHVSTHVATYDSPLFGLISKPKDRLHSKPAPQIGNDVWLARGAIVLRGVNIGDGATVGAGAVVTKDVEPYAIVAGAPARVVRYRFSNAEIASLRALEWWNDPEFYEREFERRPIGIQHFDLPHRDS